MSLRVSRLVWCIAAFSMLVVLFAPFMSARATALTFTYVRLDRMKASTASSLRVYFKTSSQTALVENKVIVKLVNYYNDTTQADTTKRFTVNATQTVSVATCAAESGATALPSSSTFSAAGDNSFTADGTAPFDTPGPTGKTITVSNVADLTASTTYCFDLTGSAVTNPSALQGYTATAATLTSGSATIDQTDVGLRIVTDDQITVSAVVPPTFNFTLSGNTDPFSRALDPQTGAAGVVSTGGITATITTNASHGWIAWVRDSSAGLVSAGAPYTIATTGTVNGAPSTINGGTEGYVMDVDLTTDFTGGGTVTIAPEYNGVTGNESGGTLSTTFQPIASADGVSGGDVLTLIERAAITGTTPAGNDYTDTLTVVGAGNF